MISLARFSASWRSCPSHASHGSLSLSASLRRAPAPPRPVSTLAGCAFQSLAGGLRARGAPRPAPRGGPRFDGGRAGGSHLAGSSFGCGGGCCERLDGAATWCCAGWAERGAGAGGGGLACAPNSPSAANCASYASTAWASSAMMARTRRNSCRSSVSWERLRSLGMHSTLSGMHSQRELAFKTASVARHRARGGHPHRTDLAWRPYVWRDTVAGTSQTLRATCLETSPFTYCMACHCVLWGHGRQAWWQACSALVTLVQRARKVHASVRVGAVAHMLSRVCEACCSKAHLAARPRVVFKSTLLAWLAPCRASHAYTTVRTHTARMRSPCVSSHLMASHRVRTAAAPRGLVNGPRDFESAPAVPSAAHARLHGPAPRQVIQCMASPRNITSVSGTDPIAEYRERHLHQSCFCQPRDCPCLRAVLVPAQRR